MGYFNRWTFIKAWDESKHPRGKTSPESNSGSFAPSNWESMGGPDAYQAQRGHAGAFNHDDEYPSLAVIADSVDETPTKLHRHYTDMDFDAMLSRASDFESGRTSPEEWEKYLTEQAKHYKLPLHQFVRSLANQMNIQYPMPKGTSVNVQRDTESPRYVALIHHFTPGMRHAVQVGRAYGESRGMAWFNAMLQVREGKYSVL